MASKPNLKKLNVESLPKVGKIVYPMKIINAEEIIYWRHQTFSIHCQTTKITNPSFENKDTLKIGRLKEV